MTENLKIVKLVDMKTFSAMSQDDLRIVRDALKEVIVQQRKVKLCAPAKIHLPFDLFQEYVGEMVNQLNHSANKISRIGKLLDAINEALDPLDSE
jgi:hypothetical protein